MLNFVLWVCLIGAAAAKLYWDKDRWKNLFSVKTFVWIAGIAIVLRFGNFVASENSISQEKVALYRDVQKAYCNLGRQAVGQALSLAREEMLGSGKQGMTQKIGEFEFRARMMTDYDPHSANVYDAPNELLRQITDAWMACITGGPAKASLAGLGVRQQLARRNPKLAYAMVLRELVIQISKMAGEADRDLTSDEVKDHRQKFEVVKDTLQKLLIEGPAVVEKLDDSSSS